MHRTARFMCSEESLKTRHIQRVIAPNGKIYVFGGKSQNPSYTEGYCTRVQARARKEESQNPSYTEGYCTQYRLCCVKASVSKPVIYRGLLHQDWLWYTMDDRLKTRHIQRVIALIALCKKDIEGLKTRHIQRVIAHTMGWYGSYASLKTRHIQRVIAPI